MVVVDWLPDGPTNRPTHLLGTDVGPLDVDWPVVGAGSRCGPPVCVAAVDHGAAAGDSGQKCDGLHICGARGGEEGDVEFLQVSVRSLWVSVQ